MNTFSPCQICAFNNIFLGNFYFNAFIVLQKSGLEGKLGV